jgi:hypothetical protein
VPLVDTQTESRRHRRGNYSAMAANENGGATMTVSDVAQRFCHSMTKTCPAVSPWDNRSERVPLLEIAQIVFGSDLFPSKTIGFS